MSAAWFGPSSAYEKHGVGEKDAMSTVMGLDFGQKRIGVAISDETMVIATPVGAIDFSSRKQLLEELTKLMDAYRVVKIVVGLPKTLQGEIGPAAQKVTEHVEWLKTYIDKPWIFWDERLSTREVERVLLAADMSRAKRKGVRDKLAAQRILQSYLDASRIHSPDSSREDSN